MWVWVWVGGCGRVWGCGGVGGCDVFAKYENNIFPG